LDTDTNKHTTTSQAKKASAVKVANELSSTGVTDNRYTKLTVADLDALEASLKDALHKRQQAYDQELAKQTSNDNLCKDVAKMNQDFVDWVQAQRSAIESFSGEPEAKIHAVQQHHQGGAPGKARLSEVVAANEGLASHGVLFNRHSPYTVPSLKAFNDDYDKTVNTYIAALGEEKELNARAKAQQAEAEAKEKAENLKIDYAKKAKAFSSWIESAADVLEEPIRAKSAEDVGALQKTFDHLVGEVPQQGENFKHLQAEGENLKKYNITDYSGFPPELLATNWAHTNKEIETRRAALVAERKKQEANDQLRHEFADRARDLEQLLNKIKAGILAGTEGDVETQLKGLQILPFAEAHKKLAEVETASKKLLDAGVTENKLTNLTYGQLKLQLDQLSETKSKKQKVLEQELLSKSGTNITAEQVAEFKEVFEHFDRNRDNLLERLELKGVLSSLGDDVSDHQLDKLMSDLSTDGKFITFENFITYMSKRITDQDSKEVIFDAFKALANDKEFIMEEDLRKALPAEKVSYLIAHMPPYPGVERGYDYKKWAEKAYST